MVQCRRCSTPALTSVTVHASNVMPEERLHITSAVLLKALLTACIQNLPDAHRTSLLQFCTQRQSTFATACSGSDSPLLGIRGVSDAVHKLVGKPWETQHLFSSEVSKAKRNFILQMFSDCLPTLLFGDCTELHEVAKDWITGSSQRVPDAMWLIAGFPCKDVSSLCNQAPEHRDAITRGHWEE